MTDANGLIAAYVTQMQRAHAQRTRGIPTPEQQGMWTQEAIDALDALKAEAWFEGADAAVDGYDLPDASNIHNPYIEQGETA